MKLKGWVIYNEDGCFIANRHREILEREWEEDEDGDTWWEGEPFELAEFTLTIPDGGSDGKV